jgi:hypothetical protein
MWATTKLNPKLKQCFSQHHSKKQGNSVPMEHYFPTSPSQIASTSALHIASNTLVRYTSKLNDDLEIKAQIKKPNPSWASPKTSSTTRM